jgi:hypothetical protein
VGDVEPGYAVPEAAGADVVEAEAEALAVELPVAAAWNAAKLLPGLTNRKKCIRSKKP